MNKQRSIVFVVPTYAPKIGGVEKHVQRVAEELAGRGNNVTVLVPGLSAEPKGTPPRLHVVPLPVLGFFSNPLNFWSARQTLQNADIIHAHDFLMGLAVLPWAQLFRKKFCVTFHGWEGRVPPRTMVAFVRRWLERRTFASILVGEFMRRWYGHTSRIVLYGGTDTNVTPSTNAKRSDHLCYVGRLADDTGVRSCIQTFMVLLQHHASLRLTVVGDGPLRAELQQAAEATHAPIDWVGWQAQPEEYYQRSVVSFTSGYLGILEALACQTTVAAFADSTLKAEYLRSTPFHDQMIIATNPNEAAQLISNRLSKADGSQSFDRQRYSWQRVVDIYEQAWQSGKQLAITQ